ncbi:sigma factor-like helix-turn-helix DNA-binding protein [Mesoplasma coleopterae]|uniref:sigma factor-like helix-turn-helix DNA-binding protein n=1 Tax=Mesoplasma coleopterae TaxID=324078 RepID=UPI0013DF3A3E|nr:sigma factor-like helix-turn-helix DNA-binding protein [Mesoplasma coleopterae]
MKITYNKTTYEINFDILIKKIELLNEVVYDYNISKTLVKNEIYHQNFNYENFIVHFVEKIYSFKFNKNNIKKFREKIFKKNSRYKNLLVKKIFENKEDIYLCFKIANQTMLSNSEVQIFLNKILKFLKEICKFSKDQKLFIFYKRLFENKTLNEVADIFDLTRERVRQIENNIIKEFKIFLDIFNFFKFNQTFFLEEKYFTKNDILSICKLFQLDKKRIETFDNLGLYVLNYISNDSHESFIVEKECFEDKSISQKLKYINASKELCILNDKLLIPYKNISEAQAIMLLSEISPYIDLSTDDYDSVMNYLRLVSKNEKSKIFQMNTAEYLDQRLLSMESSERTTNEFIRIDNKKYVNLKFISNLDILINSISQMLFHFKNNNKLFIKREELNDICELIPKIQLKYSEEEIFYLNTTPEFIYKIVKTKLKDVFFTDNTNNLNIWFKKASQSKGDLLSKLNKYLVDNKNIVIKQKEIEDNFPGSRNTILNNEGYSEIIKVTRENYLNLVTLKEVKKNLLISKFKNKIKDELIKKPFKFSYIKKYIPELTKILEQLLEVSLENVNDETMYSIFFLTILDKEIKKVNKTSISLNDYNGIHEILYEYIKMKNSIVNYLEIKEEIEKILQVRDNLKSEMWFYNALNKLVINKKIIFPFFEKLKVVENEKEIIDISMKLKEIFLNIFEYEEQVLYFDKNILEKLKINVPFSLLSSIMFSSTDFTVIFKPNYSYYTKNPIFLISKKINTNLDFQGLFKIYENQLQGELIND